MKRYIIKKRIFAVVFLIVTFLFSIANFSHGYETFKTFFVSYDDEPEKLTVKLESTINENLYGKMNFIETYGLIQVLLDKRESNNFSSIIDEDGFLHYSSFYREPDTRIFEYAMRLKKLQDTVETHGTKVLFVVTPGKYCPDRTVFRTGMSVNDPNPVVDELLFYMNRLGIETLDLRESLPNEQLSYEETFFKTDHHWTIPAAFYATGEVVKKIDESFGENLDPEGYYTDINNYDLVTYKGGMLGSMGRKTGAVFSGVEDFTAVWPRFEGDFYRECIAEEGRDASVYEGSFTEALMNVSTLTDKTDIYSDSQYSAYLHGLRIYEKIINNDNPDGPSFFMIRDSYFSPVMAFMMPMCGSMEAMWSLEETHELDIESYIKENMLSEKKFDYIIMEIYPYNIENKAFNFFKE